jgi:hypothetical protein
MDFADLFYYDETSPSCLRWKISVSSGMGRRVMVQPGDVAGSKNSHYWHVQYKGKKYKCHRIVWQLCKGLVPNKIDHIDGNSFQNKITNLRDCSQGENSRNRKKSTGNTSGVTGVHFGTDGCIASCEFEGKKLQKFFGYNKYGIMVAFKLACEHREHMVDTMNTSGAIFTERHGK